MDSKTALISRIRGYLESKDIDRAKKEISIILDRYNDNLEVLDLAVKVYRASADKLSSLKYSKLIMNNYPEQVSGFIYTSQELIGIQNLEQAKKAAQEGLLLHSKNTTLKVILWSIYQQENAYKECEQLSTKIIEENPDNVLGYNLQLKSLSKIGDRAGMYKLVEKSGLHLKDSVDLLTLKRSFYREIGAREAALISTQMMWSKKDTEIPFSAKIEYCKDLLVLNKVDQFLGMARYFGLVKESEEKMLSNLLIPRYSSILSRVEKSLLTRLDIFPHYNDLNFNPSTELVIKTSKKMPCIIFIHIGKCAGVSLLSALNNYLGGAARIFEYHTYDSNILIENLLHAAKANVNLFFVIPVRDPVRRWISAFNYELDLFYLKKSFYLPKEGHNFFSEFPNVKSLVDALKEDDERAIEFTKFHHLCFGHMAMGFNWYFRGNTRTLLPKNRTYTINQENIQSDFTRVLSSLLPQIKHSNQTVNVPKIRELNAFKGNYLNDKLITYSNDLDENTINFIQSYLEDEYRIRKDLLELSNDNSSD